MTYGPNPIAADAAHKTLVENDRLDAAAMDARTERAALDTEELRDLEQSLSGRLSAYQATKSDPLPTPASPARRSLLDRLLRRG